MVGIPSLNRVFKPVLNLASYIRYCLAVISKPGLPRLGVIKRVQGPFLVSFNAEILRDLQFQIFIGALGEDDKECISVENIIFFCLDVF